MTAPRGAARLFACTPGRWEPVAATPPPRSPPPRAARASPAPAVAATSPPRSPPLRLSLAVGITAPPRLPNQPSPPPRTRGCRLRRSFSSSSVCFPCARHRLTGVGAVADVPVHARWTPPMWRQRHRRTSCESSSRCFWAWRPCRPTWTSTFQRYSRQCMPWRSDVPRSAATFTSRACRSRRESPFSWSCTTRRSRRAPAQGASSRPCTRPCMRSWP
ncbi:hypothetical protein BU14_0204s0027 [Porphyra umbilicalis]|uniref:Uncharacterized protein n=1 Tax=Porphyra umbilicalis TaxID=2786 RepID=A0A1X6P5K8_PORUM|nr:hypothetical protein BU14_0204s0027 [Porphyra umbilicalis]|eukprot:OSX76181.1 hypothetical protein BU14_0204s0027 [Porphyra umbilicalis]